jgi:hypothetical protein
MILNSHSVSNNNAEDMILNSHSMSNNNAEDMILNSHSVSNNAEETQNDCLKSYPLHCY